MRGVRLHLRHQVMDKIFILLLITLSLFIDAAQCSNSYQVGSDGGDDGGEQSGYSYGLEQGSSGDDEGNREIGGGQDEYGGMMGGGDNGDGGSGSVSGGSDGGEGDYGGHSFHAAILSHHEVKPYLVHSKGHVKTTHIDVEPGMAPIVMTLKSRSSPIETSHKHYSAYGSLKHSYSKDKPHIWRHVVTKPVITELKEIVLPYRMHIQKVKPVQSIKTIVHRGKHHYGHGNYKKHYY